MIELKDKSLAEFFKLAKFAEQVIDLMTKSELMPEELERKPRTKKTRQALRS